MTLNWGVSTVKALVFVLVYAIALLGVLLFGTTIYVVLAACGSPIPAWTPGVAGATLCGSSTRICPPKHRFYPLAD